MDEKMNVYQDDSLVLCSKAEENDDPEQIKKNGA